MATHDVVSNTATFAVSVSGQNQLYFHTAYGIMSNSPNSVILCTIALLASYKCNAWTLRLLYWVVWKLNENTSYAIQVLWWLTVLGILLCNSTLNYCGQQKLCYYEIHSCQVWMNTSEWLCKIHRVSTNSVKKWIFSPVHILAVG